MNIILLNRKLVFSFGFVISFISVFVFEYAGNVWKPPVFYESSKKIHNQGLGWSKYLENFKIWRENENVKDSELSLDEYLYRVQPNTASGKK